MTEQVGNLNYFPKWPAIGCVAIIGIISLLDVIFIVFSGADILAKALSALVTIVCQISICYFGLIIYRAIIKFREIRLEKRIIDDFVS